MQRIYKVTLAFADRRKIDATLLFYETDHKTLTSVHNRQLASFMRTRLRDVTTQYESGASFWLALETLLGVGYGKPTRANIEALDIHAGVTI